MPPSEGHRRGITRQKGGSQEVKSGRVRSDDRIDLDRRAVSSRATTGWVSREGWSSNGMNLRHYRKQYTEPSREPTTTSPAGPMAGDESTGPSVAKDHTSVPSGATA